MSIDTNMPASLVERLQVKYPALDFDVIPKTAISEEDPEVPDLVICFEFNGMCMTAPHVTECSRFSVDPKEAYGIDHEDAEAIKAWNRILC